MTFPALSPNERLETRRAIRGSAWLLALNGDHTRVRLFDISAGGVGVISQVNLRPGQIYQINASVLLMPPEPTVLKHAVEVRYNVYSNRDGGFRVGLCFKASDEKVIEAIRHYVGAPKYTQNLTSKGVKIFA